MDEDDWLPFGVEDDDEQTAQFLALRDDVPPWLNESLWVWIGRVFTGHTTGGSPVFRDALLRQAERVLQEPMPRIGPYQRDATDRLRKAYMGKSASAPLALADFLLTTREGDGNRTSLDQTLAEARSAWRVGERRGKLGLVRRLPKGVEEAVKHASQLPNGGKRLAEAWNAAFGLAPDPSRAYSLAIVAVEDAAIPVVCPKKVDAVLGDAIGDLAANEKWKLPHQREHNQAPPREVLVSMMRMLNRGQHDRHGGAPVPLPDMTQAEAESAVMLAATLVGWFSTDKVTKS
ncbi:hypothetical protein CQY21_26480 [Mycolicibacterium boenickei]|nr:hypothetical protein CQY21_26480 [Mycolicibacterium boenickei]